MAFPVKLDNIHFRMSLSRILANKGSRDLYRYDVMMSGGLLG